MRRGTTLNDLMQWDNTLFDQITIPEEVNKEILVSYIMLSCGLMETLYQEYDVFKSHVNIWFAAHEWNIEKLINLIKQQYEPLWNYNKREDLHGEKQYDGTQDVALDGTKKKTGDVKTDTDIDATVNNKYGGNDVTERTDTFGEEYGRNLNTTDNVTTTFNTQVETDTTGSKSSTANSQNYVTAFNTAQRQETTSTTSQGSEQYQENTVESKTGTEREEGVKVETGEQTKTGENVREETIKHGKTLDTTTDEKRRQTQTFDTTEATDNDTHTIDQNKTVTGETNHIYGNVGVTTYQKMFLEEYEVLENVNLYEWITRRFTNDLMIGVYV